MRRMPLALSALASAIASFSANAEPTALNLAQLDSITAGTWGEQSNPAPNGGAIVGNGSSANLQSTGEVNLSDGAQTDATALNLVNGSESTIANGVNIFDGRTDAGAEIDSAQFDVSQSNMVEQDQRRLSSLPSYARGANTETTTSSVGTSESSATSSLTDNTIDLERTTTSDSATTVGSYDRSGAPTLRVEASGNLDLGTAYSLDGSYMAEFNMPSASNSFGGTFNGGIDYDLDGGQVDVDTGDLGVDVTVELPEFHLGVDAAGCIAVNGNCTIDATRVQTSDEISDHSMLYSADETSSSSESWDDTTRTTVAAPFELHNAQAEYIVVDESDIDVSAAYLVALSGSAQSNLRALNAVNAAGSAVANGVNLALHRSGELETVGPTYQLSQVNNITHSR